MEKIFIFRLFLIINLILKISIKKKKINYSIKNSSKGVNSIKVIDNEKIYKNLRLKINIEYSINKNTKMENIQFNTDYELSDVNTFIRKLTIISDFGEIKIENLFASEIEILMN